MGLHCLKWRFQHIGSREKRNKGIILIVKGYEEFSFCFACLCFSYKLLPFFAFLREFFTILLVKYFFVEQKQSLGGVP